MADGLHAGFNATETEYVVDDSSIYSEQESEETFGKTTSCRSTDIFEEDHIRSSCITDGGNRMDFNSGSSTESLLNREINLARPLFERKEYASHFHVRHLERPSTNFGKCPKREDSMAHSFDTAKLYPDEIIELEKFSKSRYYCPSEKDSGTSGAVSREIICRRDELCSRDDVPTVDNEGRFFIAGETFAEEKSVIQSEPTVYPEEESICNATTDQKDDNDCRRLGGKMETDFARPTRVDKKLLELGRTLRTARSSFSRKYSSNVLNEEEYVVRIIDAILQTVKSSFEEVNMLCNLYYWNEFNYHFIIKKKNEPIIQVDEGEKNANKKRHRKSKCTAERSKKSSEKQSSDNKHRKIGASGDHFCSSKRKVRTSPQNDSFEDSGKRYNTYFLIPGYDMDLPIFTSTSMSAEGIVRGH